MLTYENPVNSLRDPEQYLRNPEQSLRGAFPQIEVHVFHRDAQVCEAIAVALRVEGFRVSLSLRHEDFVGLAAARRPTIIIVEVEMNGKSGPEVVYGAVPAGEIARVLVVADRTDMMRSVEAMQHGALDVIALPLDSERLYQQVRGAVASLPAQRASQVPVRLRVPAKLTTREREVLEQIVSGHSNKEVGALLSISPRTVEVHRARVMEKLGARNVADLVRMVVERTP